MNSAAYKAKFIGIDWGTSSLRAYLIDAQGVVLETLSTADGIMQVQGSEFETTLLRLLEPWLTVSPLPVIASGMITSRNGWMETPYLSLPATTRDLATALQAVSTSREVDLHFVTGLAANLNGTPDVMRGEETQVIGAIDKGLVNAVIVLPGTHSKWVTVRKGCIDAFTTYMSGELFATLSQHTILGKLMKASDFNEAGFSRGVNDGYSAGSQLLSRLFHVRTLPLFELLGEEQVSDYLSGMLIGAEIHAAIDSGVGEDQITIIGKHDLADRYALALQMLEKNIHRADDHIVARGHYAIAKSAELI